MRLGSCTRRPCTRTCIAAWLPSHVFRYAAAQLNTTGQQAYGWPRQGLHPDVRHTQVRLDCRCSATHTNTAGRPTRHLPAQFTTTVKVRYALYGGTAVYGTDYTAPGATTPTGGGTVADGPGGSAPAGSPTGVVAIGTNQSSATIPITIVGNDVFSGANKTFDVELTDVYYTVLGATSSATVTIVEDDVPVRRRMGGAEGWHCVAAWRLHVGPWGCSSLRKRERLASNCQ